MPRPNGEKPKKVPYTPGTNQRARVNDRTTWRSYAEALDDAERTGRYPGVALTPAMNLTLIDGDDQVDGDLIARLDSYTERSLNGGLHILVSGRPPDGFTVPPELEVYPRNGNRFLLLTGDIIDGRETINERSAVLADLCPPGSPRPLTTTTTGGVAIDTAEATRRVRSMSKGRRLFDDGDISDYPSHSEAVLALLNYGIRAGVTDPDQLDTLYRQSALARTSDHWEKADYRSRTLATALNGTVQPWNGWTAPHSPPPPQPLSPSTEPCAERVAALERQIAERDQTIAVAQQTISALVQTILNPDLTHTEKIAAVSVASTAQAKRASGTIEPDGRVTLSTYEISDDHRPKAEPKGHVAPVNPKSGRRPRMTRASVPDLMKRAIERGLIQAEPRPVRRTRANGAPYSDWEYVVAPAASLAEALNPWAQYRPEEPTPRKVRESRACPHCHEVRPLHRVDSCTGCGAIVAEGRVDPPIEMVTETPRPMGENFSPIADDPDPVAPLRTGRKTFSHSDPHTQEPPWLADAPDLQPGDPPPVRAPRSHASWSSPVSHGAPDARRRGGCAPPCASDPAAVAGDARCGRHADVPERHPDSL